MKKNDEIETASNNVSLKTSSTHTNYSDDWVNWIWQCFGAKGLVVLTYWFGSLFAEQIRSSQGSYPFLGLFEQSGSVRNTLLEFLWTLFGHKNYREFDLANSSRAACIRHMSDVANLPCIFINSSDDYYNDIDENTHSFNLGYFKPAYNGTTIDYKGLINNTLIEIRFKGTLLISQQKPLKASEAILSRFVNVDLTGTLENSEYSKNLREISKDQINYFLEKIFLSKKSTMNIVNKNTNEYEDFFMRNTCTTSARASRNHSQLLAILDALSDVIHLTKEMKGATVSEILNMAWKC